jgi:hypothetical protein
LDTPGRLVLHRASISAAAGWPGSVTRFHISKKEFQIVLTASPR